MKEYNGHRSWNAWNVSLWINNEEWLYNYCKDITGNYSLSKATRVFMRHMVNQKTPDGAAYNALSVKLALKDFYTEEE